MTIKIQKALFFLNLNTITNNIYKYKNLYRNDEKSNEYLTNVK